MPEESDRTEIVPMDGHEAEIETLKTQHHDLDRQLVEENERPHPDSAKIGELKRRKLRIKDDIARLSRV